MYSYSPRIVLVEDHKSLLAFVQLVFVSQLIVTEEECVWHKQEERSGESKVGIAHSLEAEENSTAASFEIHSLSRCFSMLHGMRLKSCGGHCSSNYLSTFLTM